MTLGNGDIIVKHKYSPSQCAVTSNLSVYLCNCWLSSADECSGDNDEDVCEIVAETSDNISLILPRRCHIQTNMSPR